MDSCFWDTRDPLILIECAPGLTNITPSRLNAGRSIVWITSN